ncbi:unnamed protein product [Protopolystoma xenopodis]|uniref:Uncharacterized protein n=1 Tax=Protopolystoma xenopodis TaxID=117903 RepID=A0A448WII7_9PLAT|nr:unnamed protein product [Protopolystoma xenopodis]
MVDKENVASASAHGIYDLCLDPTGVYSEPPVAKASVSVNRLAATEEPDRWVWHGECFPVLFHLTLRSSGRPVIRSSDRHYQNRIPFNIPLHIFT